MSDLDLEKGFDESELEDIMSEIESLEKDFVTSVDSEEVVAEAVEEKVEAEPVVEASEPIAEVTTEVAPDAVMEEVTPEPAMAEMPAEQEPIAEEAPVEEIVASTPEEPVVEEAVSIEQRLESEFDAQEVSSSAEDLKIAPEEIEKTSIQAEIESEVESILEEEPVAEVVEMEEVKQDIKPEMSAPMAGETKMDFSVSGQMNLKLHFWVNGQGVDLHVSESEGFVIEMENGAKFSIPLSDKKAA